MKLSQEKRDAVFAAIHSPIMDQRVIINGRNNREKDFKQRRQFEQIDNELFYLDVDIFKRVLAALNVKES